MRNISLQDALGEARERFTARRPRSRAMHERACQALPGGNTRTVLWHGPFPLRAAGGQGAVLTDVDGHAYLNLLGEYTAGVFGHDHPAIRRAVEEAMAGGLNLGAHGAGEVDLAERVVARFPALERVRFTNSGTEANLMAVSTARHVTGRQKVMVFDGAYHGALLSFGGGGIPINAPFPYALARYNDAEGAVRAIQEAADDLACVLVEPMLGAGGCIPAEPSFLAALRHATTDTGTLLIFDEVMTSRFGRHGAAEMIGIRPDLMTLGKWVGGGLSFGAFGGRADLMAVYDPSAPGAVPHAGTFNNNALTMRAGVAALDEAFTPDIAEALHTRGEALRARLETLFNGHGVALSATGVGSLMTIHPCAPPVTSPAELARADAAARELVFLDLLERGFYMANRGFIALSIAVTDADIEAFLAALDAILTERRTVLPQRGPVLPVEV
jgi:glutamate-1-semialdehyde 2,1-aminomutase